MSKTIDIKNGVSIVAMAVDTDHSLTGYNDNKVNSFKTLKNGIWTSWSKGTPEAFQGFNKLESGLGYVVIATDPTTIEVEGGELDINTVDISTGLSLLALPFDGKKIVTKGVLPRIEVSTIKTINNTAWGSWKKGAAEAFQGFTTLNKDLGYVCEVTKVYGKYISKDSKVSDTGIKLSEAPVESTPDDSILNIGGVPEGFTIKSINHPSGNAPATSGNKSSMKINIDGKSITINYPVEYENTKFTINKVGYEIIDGGRITDDVTIVDPGTITEAVTETKDFGRVNNRDFVIDVEYEYTFVNNPVDTANPNKSIKDDILEIMYDVVSFDDTKDMKIMHMTIEGDVTRVSFAEEYLGDNFKVIRDKKIYNGTFVESFSPVPLNEA